MKTSILSSNSVMESRDHRLLSVAAVKNGANPKSQTSRGNIFRKVLFLACFAVFASVCVAQDIIVTKDSKRINAKVTEVNEDNVRYKNFDNLDGPVYTLPKSNIVTILYQNGQVETFETESPKSAAATQTTPATGQTAASNPNRTQTVNSGNILVDMKTNHLAIYRQYKKGMSLRTTGWIVAGSGVIVAALASWETFNEATNDKERRRGYIGMAAGGFFVCTGVPLFIVGGNKKNCALDEFNRQYYSSQPANPHFQMNVYPNGVGLAYKF